MCRLSFPLIPSVIILHLLDCSKGYKSVLLKEVVVLYLLTALYRYKSTLLVPGTCTTYIINRCCVVMSESNSHSKKTFVQLQAYVAQSVERPAFNRVVAGSIPAMGMITFCQMNCAYLILRLILWICHLF